MPRRAKPAPKQQATVTKLANETPAVAKNSHTNGEILDRIKKCLDRAEHANANESEARAAMKIATRLMSQHNVTQAELIDNEKLSEREQRGGLSLVKISPSKEGGHPVNWAWADEVVSAVTKLFDCDAFHTQSAHFLEWKFYGIAENTAFAAISFAVNHNLILHWADAFTTVQGRNSYCLGVANGLRRLAKEERLNMENAARENEQKGMAARIREEELERQKAIARLSEQHSSPKAEELSLEDSDYEPHDDRSDMDIGNDDDGDDETLVANATYHEQHAASMPELTGDLEADIAATMREEVMSNLKREEWMQEDDEDEDVDLSEHNPALSSQSDIKNWAPVTLGEERESSLQWSSMTQLLRFRENAAAVGEDVLRAQGIKLKKASKRTRSVKDLAAYHKGKKDSKRINLRVAVIEEGRSSI